MKQTDIEPISLLRTQNYSYQFIADKLGMPMNTVKSICRRRGIEAEGARKTKREKTEAVLCKNCMRILNPGSRKDAVFCSDSCRTEWRRKNRRILEKTP